MTFEVPSHVRPLRDAVHAFMTERVEPAEPVLASGDREALRALQQEAKDAGLWALGHPKELGGGGLPFLDYVFVNEVQGRSEWGQLALGTFTLQDSLMLNEYAGAEWRERYLAPMVAGDISPSFAMTEPEATGSDPTGIRTTGTLEGDEWVIRGHKWFTTRGGCRRVHHGDVPYGARGHPAPPGLQHDHRADLHAWVPDRPRDACPRT
jgi:acyl-CoA dehydrogenase